MYSQYTSNELLWKFHETERINRPSRRCEINYKIVVNIRDWINPDQDRETLCKSGIEALSNVSHTAGWSVIKYI